MSGVVALARLEAMDLLVMFAQGGVDIGPLLQEWACCDSDWALLQYASLCADLENPAAPGNAFADDLPTLLPTLREWAFQTPVFMHFAQRWEGMTDQDASHLAQRFDGHQDETDIVGVLGVRHNPG